MFKITFRPNRAVSKTFINCFGNDPKIQKQTMQKAQSSVAKYWYNNVYRYFDARESHGLPNTGQLGKALRATVSGAKLELAMIELHNERTFHDIPWSPRMPTFSGAMNFQPFSMPSMGIGRSVNTDYGKLLREGTAPSSGNYSFKYDCRIKTGIHPGYDPKTRWEPWMKDFKEATRGIVMSYMMKELRKLGISPGLTWRVDINI